MLTIPRAHEVFADHAAAGKTSAMAVNLNRAFAIAFAVVYLLVIASMRLVQS
jgi:hypothetical protein